MRFCGPTSLYLSAYTNQFGVMFTHKRPFIIDGISYMLPIILIIDIQFEAETNKQLLFVFVISHSLVRIAS